MFQSLGAILHGLFSVEEDPGYTHCWVHGLWHGMMDVSNRSTGFESLEINDRSQC